MVSGDNLEIIGRVRKLLKRALAHENFLKTQVKNYEKGQSFLENEDWHLIFGR